MFVKELALIVNDLDLLLDEFEVVDRKRDSRRLLERAVLLSIRGIAIMLREPLIEGVDGYLESMEARLDNNAWAIAEELRHDSTTLELFLAAECRLLQDIGLSDSAVARIRNALEGTIREGSSKPEELRGRMTSLLNELTAELSRLYDSDRHRKLISQLAGVFEALGGALVIATNVSVGALGAPVSAGVTLVGAAVSTAAGTEVISRGVDRATA